MDAAGECQGPKYGSRIRVDFVASAGTHKNYGIEPSTFWDSRALFDGSSLGDPSGSPWDSPSNFGVRLPSLLGVSLARMGLRPSIQPDRPPGPS
jgi:hypothetical protein